MRIYYDQDFDLAITEEQFNSIPEDEKEDFKILEINIKENDEMTIEELNNYMTKASKYNALEHYSVKETLEDKSIEYGLTDTYYLNFDFEVVEKIQSKRKPDLLKTKIKITAITVE